MAMSGWRLRSGFRGFLTPNLRRVCSSSLRCLAFDLFKISLLDQQDWATFDNGKVSDVTARYKFLSDKGTIYCGSE